MVQTLTDGLFMDDPSQSARDDTSVLAHSPHKVDYLNIKIKLKLKLATRKLCH